MQQIIAQLIGCFGLFFIVTSFQKNNHKGILLFQTLGAFTFTIHFLLLGGAVTGAAMNFLGGVRNIIFAYRPRKWASHPAWIGVFLLLYLVAGILTWRNIYSLFPMLAMMLATIGLWIKDAKKIRLVMLPASPCWLTYNIVNQSFPGIFTEIFVLSSLLIAIVRFDILKKKEK